MVKIVHFISTSGLYGAERWILGLLGHLDNFETLLICPSTSDKSLIKEAERLGIKTRLLKVKGNYAIFDFINKLANLLKEEKINILHTHGYKSDIIGYFAARKAKIMIISTPHGWSIEAGLKLKIYESLDRFFLKFFDSVAPLSESLKKSLGNIKKNKITVINNFVDSDTIPQPKKGDLGLITYIGQLIERKRVKDLIVSLKYVKDHSVKLQVIGDGPRKEELINLTKKLDIQDRVKFLGFRKDRLELLNRSGVFVLPSLLEGIPRSMMEAMAMKKIVIGTNIPGIMNLIEDKKTGLLVPTKNPMKIAEALDWVLKNKGQVEKMAESARVLIEKRFFVGRAVKEYRNIYKQVLGMK